MTYREAVARLLALRGGEMAGMRPGLRSAAASRNAAGRCRRAPMRATIGQYVTCITERMVEGA